MKKITVQDRAEKFINELGKYAVGNFKYWFPFCKLQKNISVIAYDLDRIYKENCIEQIERVVFVKRKCEQKGPKKVSTFSTRFHVVSNVFPKYQMLTF